MQLLLLREDLLMNGTAVYYSPTIYKPLIHCQ